LSGKLKQELSEKLEKPALVFVLCAFLRFPNLTTSLANPLISALDNKGMQVLAKQILPKLESKVIDHICKTWVVSPIATGIPRGAPSVGRGDYSYKFFNSKPWW
jgi:hypothetical protein